MEKITRTIVREREGRPVEYVFQTYSLIFEEQKKENLRRFCAYAKKAFVEGMSSDSSLKSPSQSNGVFLDVIRVDDYEPQKIAHAANYYGRRFKQHAIVQDALLSEDPNTIATELPLVTKTMQGNVDVIRYMQSDDSFQLVDFKPEAKKEKKVTGQLWHYAKMFHDLTGIQYSKIKLFYFDGEDAFEVLLPH